MGDIVAFLISGMGGLLVLGSIASLVLWGYSLKNTSAPIFGIDRVKGQGWANSSRYSSASSTIVRTHGVSTSIKQTNSLDATKTVSPSITRSRLGTADGMALLRHRSSEAKKIQEVKGKTCPTPKMSTYIRQRLNRQ